MQNYAKAEVNYVRISPRKVKIVIDLIRNKPVGEALAILKHTPKAASEIVEKLLLSAMANAENNHGMDVEKLYVAEIYSNADGLSISTSTDASVIGGYLDQIDALTIVKDEDKDVASGS